MVNQRMKAIHDAAALLFLRQGYSKTQISHIAKAVDVSVGTIYHDFIGKREILNFVLKCTIDPAFMEREFDRPIRGELFDGLDSEIMAAFDESAASFAAHLADGAANYTFPELISDTFDLLSRYAVGCLFIEKNQFDFPKLAQSYRAYRERFFDTMTRYLALFIEKGEIRPLQHLALSTSLIVEMLTWWAMDQRYISFEARPIPPALAKAVCLDNLIFAYLVKE